MFTKSKDSDSIAKPRIVVFGASAGGIRFLKRCGYQYEVIALCDNDPCKQNTKVSGYDVLSPDRLDPDEFDSIIVASMYGMEIRHQLAMECEIPEERILFAPKSALSPDKSYRPFEDPHTLSFARQMLEFMVNLLVGADIPYYLDHGTLLGLYRDGDLMPWDDDLDISVPDLFVEHTLQALRDRRTDFPHAQVLEWHGEIVSDADNNQVMGLIFTFEEENRLQLRKFAISIWFMFREGGQIKQYINVSPEHYFNGSDQLFYRGQVYSIPIATASYLEFHYGNWREPIKDMSLQEIQNYCPPPPNVQRDDLFRSWPTFP